ncbi:hypothetical protein [Streptomyces spongiae]|uniref:Uncharacterized protein n=1 Tax=Streptomyces spongiae TaxID=565072 RepID=A0A5N8XLU6_9ACTN|nr:hypothetical protein [Streptomyces spongiae]MPY60224.1 hypothetical protein [Streptomyces spongiae]
MWDLVGSDGLTAFGMDLMQGAPGFVIARPVKSNRSTVLMNLAAKFVGHPRMFALSGDGNRADATLDKAEMNFQLNYRSATTVDLGDLGKKSVGTRMEIPRMPRRVKSGSNGGQPGEIPGQQ